MRLIPFSLAACLLLAACGDDPEPVQEGDERSATGEVLEGTISDEMIATDKVRSQPPLLRTLPQSEGAGDAETEGDDAEGEAPADGEAAESPAPAPSFAPDPVEPAPAAE